MATEVIMPKQGLQMTEGKIVEWKVKEGDPVTKGQAILEIETDKLNIDIDAPESGTMLKMLYKTGDVVPIAEVIAYIGAPGETVAASGKAATVNAAMVTPSALPAAAATPKASAAVPADKPAASNGKIYASPRARWRAAEAGLELEGIFGTGPEALIVERDVLAALAKGKAPVKAAPATPLAQKIAAAHNVELAQVAGSGSGGRVTRNDVMDVLTQAGRSAGTGEVSERDGGYLIPHSSMRKVIAGRMKESLALAAQANHRMDVDASGIRTVRDALKNSGINASYTDILIKITALALKKHPLMNSSWTDDGVYVKTDINIGMAIAVENGLIVPVVQKADGLSIAEINGKTRKLIEKAKSGGLKPADVGGGTFTITNLGMYDVDSFTAIINQPESGILAVGRIVDKPAVVNGAITIRPMVTLSLTYDHRVIDGAPAAEFLQTVKRGMENPFLLL